MNDHSRSRDLLSTLVERVAKQVAQALDRIVGGGGVGRDEAAHRVERIEEEMGVESGAERRKLGALGKHPGFRFRLELGIEPLLGSDTVRQPGDDDVSQDPISRFQPKTPDVSEAATERLNKPCASSGIEAATV